MHNLVTKEALEKAVAGDHAAFRILVEKYHAFVFRLSCRFLGDRGDAQDATQETFIRLWKNIHRYDSTVKLTTWLYKITSNLCLDVLKSSRWKHHATQRMMDLPDSPDSTSADEALLNEELNNIVFKMASTLTPKQKAVFILRDVEGLAVPEVCAALSMSAANVKGNLYHARLKMSTLLQKHYQQTDQYEM